jgi:hypothetical protein
VAIRTAAIALFLSLAEISIVILSPIFQFRVFIIAI